MGEDQEDYLNDRLKPNSIGDRIKADIVVFAAILGLSFVCVSCS